MASISLYLGMVNTFSDDTLALWNDLFTYLQTTSKILERYRTVTGRDDIESLVGYTRITLSYDSVWTAAITLHEAQKLLGQLGKYLIILTGFFFLFKYSASIGTDNDKITCSNGWLSIRSGHTCFVWENTISPVLWVRFALCLCRAPYFLTSKADINQFDTHAVYFV